MGVAVLPSSIPACRKNTASIAAEDLQSHRDDPVGFELLLNSCISPRKRLLLISSNKSPCDPLRLSTRNATRIAENKPACGATHQHNQVYNGARNEYGRTNISALSMPSLRVLIWASSWLLASSLKSFQNSLELPSKSPIMRGSSGF